MRATLQAGLLKRMTELETKVYLVMAINSDYLTGDVRMSAERLAREVGTQNVGRARKARDGLAAMGAIAQIEEGGGFKNVGLYRLVCPPALAETPLFSGVETGTLSVPPQTGTLNVPVSENYKDAQRQRTGTVSDGYRDAQRQETGTLSVPRSTHSNNSPHSNRRHSPPPPSPSPPHGTPMRDPSAAGAGHVDPPDLDQRVEFLVGKKVFPKQARRFARHFAMPQLLDHWRSIVNDGRIRDKGAAMAARLREHLPDAGQ